MTDKEKKLIVDAIVELADVTSTHDADHRVRDKKYVGVSKEVATVTDKLAKELDIAEEVNSVLIKHIFNDFAKLLAALFDDAEDDDEDDEEGEE